MTVRAKHNAAYAASMFSLLVFQIIASGSAFAGFSNFHLDVVYSVISQSVCMGVIPLGVLLLLRRKDGVRCITHYMRYKKPVDPKVCILASLALFVLITPFTMVFNALTSLIFKIIGYKRSVNAPTVYGGVSDLLVMCAVTALLPAVFEEFTHRGILLSGLEDRGSEMSAIVWSAVAFGLMHTNPAQFLYATVGGLVFGIAVTKTGSMIPAMTAHFANNFIGTVLDYSTQKRNALGVLYERLSGSDSVVSFAALLVVLGFSVYGIIKLLEYLARKAEKPIMERKLFGIVPLDCYKAEGKASLKDNAFFIATVTSETFLLAALLIWGVFK